MLLQLPLIPASSPRPGPLPRPPPLQQMTASPLHPPRHRRRHQLSSPQTHRHRPRRRQLSSPQTRHRRRRRQISSPPTLGARLSIDPFPRRRLVPTGAPHRHPRRHLPTGRRLSSLHRRLSSLRHRLQLGRVTRLVSRHPAHLGTPPALRRHRHNTVRLLLRRRPLLHLRPRVRLTSDPHLTLASGAWRLWHPQLQPLQQLTLQVPVESECYLRYCCHDPQMQV